MKFDTPAGRNPVDQLRVVGRPTERIDGALKVAGQAAYAYERQDAGAAPAYGYVVGAGIAKGRVAMLDAEVARGAPGVLAVLSTLDYDGLPLHWTNTANLFGGPIVEHYHQAVALVVAQTFEQARYAAGLIAIDYEPDESGVYDLAASLPSAGVDPGSKDQVVGDFAAAFAAAPVTINATYTTPDETHAMMEPHATLASWDGDRLTVWTSNQMIDWARQALTKSLSLTPENVRVVSEYVGGGFGGKLWIRADAVLAALGARAAGRPVKVAFQRPLIANNTTHRAATVQRIRLGAASDGTLLAIGHECWSGNLPGGSPEGGTAQTKLVYASANRLVGERLSHLDLPEGNAMRAPGEAPGMMALEVAMDEMAEALGMDPVEFRIRNDTQVDPENPQRRFSQRQLVECLRLGADLFGWSARDPRPGNVRDGNWRIGLGVAAGFRNNLTVPSAARVRLESDGRVTVETDMTDIGTGSYTIIAQTAAEVMGIPLEQVEVRLGDSEFPVSAGSGGQFGANCSTAGVYAACMALRDKVARQLGFNSPDVWFEGGQVCSGNRRVPLAEAARAGAIACEDRIEFTAMAKEAQQSTFAAHFVEAAVEAFTGEVRVRRMLAVCAAGRILNPLTARSQVIGAMTMGLGAALTEALAVDKVRGFFVNHDLAGYEVPTHADIPHQEAIFLDEVDPVASPMKAKGVGELGLCGVGAAIANAIYNASGVRVRDFPITPDKLIVS